MSDRIIESFNEMKQIYLGSISGNYIQKGNEYLNYITEDKKEGPGEEYEDKYKKTGKKSKDYDEDGKVEDDADEYAGVKDKAIKKAMGNPYEKEEEDEKEDTKSKKSKKTKKEKELDENFSNWRDELYEAIGDIESEIDASKEKQIVEKPVKNKIEINPTISIAEQVLSVEELGEDYIHNVIDLATEFFYENGINDVGIKLIAEQLGEIDFTDYVFGIAEEFSLYEEYLYEKTRQQKELEKKGGAAPRQTVSSGKRKGMHYSQLKQEDPKAFEKAIRSTKQHKEREKTDAEYIKSHGEKNPYIERSSRTKGYSGPSQRQKMAKNITMDKGNIATAQAKQEQPNKKPNKSAIGFALLNVIDKAATAAKSGMERHNAATKQLEKMAQETGKTAAKVASTANKSAQTIGTGLRSPFETKAGRNAQAALIKGTRRIAHDIVRAAAKQHAKRKVASENLKETIELLEKATSEQQQKIFGVALSVKRGDTPRSKVSDEVLKIVDGMSEAEIRKFASTAHKGLPKRA